ncbi:MAG: leucyl aminopeptidase [Thermodesulfobacteriota bacterium]
MLKLSNVAPLEYGGDLVAFCVRQPKRGAPASGHAVVDSLIRRVHAAGDFSGKEGETILHYPDPAASASPRAKRVLVVGLGKDPLSRELFRKAGGTIAATAQKGKSKRIMVVAPEKCGFPVAELTEALAEGLTLGAYSFRKYKTNGQEDAPPSALKEIVLFAGKGAGVQSALKLGSIAARAACLARDMAHEPANHWTPNHFAEFGERLAASHGLVCTVLDRERMQQLGMGGILAVNQGSAQPPKLVIVEYHTAAKAPTILLVGKGLTFDSGGISLKPGSGMEEMKYDMCGGAAVLCAMQAVAEARLKGVNLVAMVPATENLPGPAAVKPGDLITQYGGKTVEVVNTDAEGRLILADALAYGIATYKPDLAIDLATLTGAVIVGLGHHRTGLLSNSDPLCEQLLAAGERSGEPLWRLPLGPEYTKQLKSEIADLKNVGDRSGGTITGAAFLGEFVGDTPWAHLDIAGTAWSFTEKPYIPKGPSGIGVRTLFDFVRNFKKIARK